MKGKIPPEFLQKIRDSLNFVDLVGEHVVLRKTGSNFMGQCPFHSDRSPSFSVSSTKPVFHCFGCQKSGDIFDFVREIFGISFVEAVEELAERARLSLPRDWEGGEEDPEVRKKRQQAREKLQTASRLNRFVAKFFHDQLSRNSQVESYFRVRGVGGPLIRNFYLGAAPASWDALSSHLLAKQAPLPLAVELGLISPSKKGAGHVGGPGYFDLFRNRAMFPILDMRGKVAGFGGRLLAAPEGAPEMNSESPKYLNSRESLLFQKGRLFFGLYQAQKHIRDQREMILVEGYFDVLALHAAGFENVVATCGTALTPDHLQILKRFADRVIVLFDGDKAGVLATEKAMEAGLELGMILHGATLPDELDPDEVLFDQTTGEPWPEGKEKMKLILGSSKPILDARIEDWIRAAKAGPEDRTRALKKIGGWLARLKDPIGLEVRLEAIQSQLGVSRSLLNQAIGKGEIQAPKDSVFSRPVSLVTAPPSRKSALSISRRGGGGTVTGWDRVFFRALLQGGEFTKIIEVARDKLPPESSICDLAEYRPARDFLEIWLKDRDTFERLRMAPEVAMTPDMDSQVRTLLTESLMNADHQFDQKDFEVALERSIGRTWARFSQRIREALAKAEASKDAELHSKLMKEFLDVQRRMKEFNSFYDEA